jgi:FkbM family methyltransferase
MIKQLIKSIFNHVGLDVSYSHPERLEGNRVLHVVKNLNLDIVVDVGANVGQFGVSLIKAGFKGRLISFEPLAAEHAKLTQVARRYPNWHVASRVALGEDDGELVIHRSGNSESSSFLPMLQKHIHEMPNSQLIGEENVWVRRLDQCREVSNESGNLFLKVDTQGYELRVLQGATGIMPRVAALLLEASIVPLYEGCPLIAEVIDSLRGYGFEVADLYGAFTSRDGQMLQVNIIAVRRTNELRPNRKA